MVLPEASNNVLSVHCNVKRITDKEFLAIENSKLVRRKNRGLCVESRVTCGILRTYGSTHDS
jgi:hypothetical protein